MRRKLLVLLLALALRSSAARAHDLWLEPSSFRPAVGEKVEVSLRVGHPGGEAESVARNPARILRFSAIAEGREKPVLGVDGGEPAGLLRPEQPGMITLLYRTNNARQELPGPKFEAYLVEEGLPEISLLRRQNGQQAMPGRELYSRALKALVAVGGEAEGGDQPRGLDFELVAEANPFTLAPRAVLPVRVLRFGRPAAGVLVEALPLDGGTGKTSAISDREGRLRLELARPGGWMLAAVTMTEAPPGMGAEWQSIWTSLTFSIPEP